MRATPVFRALTAGAALALCALAWWLLAPSQLGGRTGYAVIVGTSMEPSLTRGDLALVRKRQAYAPGDAVLYRNDQLRSNVLHRIVERDGSRFVLRGDNNPAADVVRPAPGDVIGELWVVVPFVGRAVAWLREPLNAAIALFIVSFLVLGGGRELARRRTDRLRSTERRGDSPPGRRLFATGPALLSASVAALGIFALLAIAGWTRPPTTTAHVAGAYAHTGTFSYAGKVRRSPVYPDGRIDTGETAFVKLAHRLLVSFSYRLESRESASVRGAISLAATVGDGLGWTRTLRLAGPQPFSRGRAEISGTLDLTRLTRIVERMRALTGSGTSTFSVRVAPRIEALGYIGSSVLDATFAPTLPLLLDQTALRLDLGDGSASLFRPRQSGSITRIVDARLGVGVLSASVQEARRLATLGLVVALVLAAAAAFLVGRRGGFSESDEIEERFGGRIVDAAVPPPSDRQVTELADIESLVRIAVMHDRMIVRHPDGAGYAYLVDDVVALYRFRAGAGAPTRTLVQART